MRTTCSVFVIATVIQVMSGQENEPPNPRSWPKLPHEELIPSHCRSPPQNIHPFECCPIPNLYPDEVLDACGIKKQSDKERPRDLECKNGKCVMKTAKLLKDDESIDYEKVSAFVDNWGKSNPYFEEAIQKAKSVCVREGGPPGAPPKHIVCEQDSLYACLTTEILWNCKMKQDVEKCRDLKKHMDECRPYYHNVVEPRDQIAGKN